MADNTSKTTVVYEDEELLVIRRAGSSKYLFVTFGDAITFVDGHRFFADIPADKADISCIGFVAKRDNWYPVGNMHRAAGSIVPHLRRHDVVVGYGGSMGGYAAIKFSNLLHLTHVIAFCPQWSIDKSVCDGVDPGWQACFRDLNVGMGIRHGDASGRIYLFYDPYDPTDAFHARKIRAVADVETVALPRVSHNVTTVMSGTSNLLGLIENCLNGDVRAMKREAQALRRRHHFRVKNLVDHIKARYPLKFGKWLLSRIDRELFRNEWREYLFYAIAYLCHFGAYGRAGNIHALYCRSGISPSDQFVAALFIAEAAGCRVGLETHHGSRLFYDLGGRSLVHSMRRDAMLMPINIRILADKIMLWIEIGDQKLFIDAGGRPVVSNAATNEFHHDLVVEDRFKEKGLPDRFSVKVGPFYLTAPATARIVERNRTEAFDWEAFKIGFFDDRGHRASGP